MKPIRVQIVPIMVQIMRIRVRVMPKAAMCNCARTNVGGGAVRSGARHRAVVYDAVHHRGTVRPPASRPACTGTGRAAMHRTRVAQRPTRRPSSRCRRAWQSGCLPDTLGRHRRRPPAPSDAPAPSPSSSSSPSPFPSPFPSSFPSPWVCTLQHPDPLRPVQDVRRTP